MFEGHTVYIPLRCCSRSGFLVSKYFSVLIASKLQHVRRTACNVLTPLCYSLEFKRQLHIEAESVGIRTNIETIDINIHTYVNTVVRTVRKR